MDAPQAQRFKTHIRDKQGRHAADVWVEVSPSGLNLQGNRGPLGKFGFARILQWALEGNNCFVFTVQTEQTAGPKDIWLYSDPRTIKSLLNAVESTVASIVDKRRGLAPDLVNIYRGPF